MNPMRHNPILPSAMQPSGVASMPASYVGASFVAGPACGPALNACDPNDGGQNVAARVASLCDRLCRAAGRLELLDSKFAAPPGSEARTPDCQPADILSALDRAGGLSEQILHWIGQLETHVGG